MEYTLPPILTAEPTFCPPLHKISDDAQALLGRSLSDYKWY